MTKVIESSCVQQKSSHRYPDVPIPSIRLYVKWGEKRIRNLIRYHHYLLMLSGTDILSYERERFEFVTKKTEDFFIEILSHKNLTTAMLGYPALKMRYFDRTITLDDRELWLETFKKAILQCKMPSECIEEFWNWIEALSLWMVNAPVGERMPNRYLYVDIWTDFAENLHISVDSCTYARIAV